MWFGSTGRPSRTSSTGKRVVRASASRSRLGWAGSRCWINTNAAPVASGRWRSRSLNASSPPADAPTPTTGNVVIPGAETLSTVSFTWFLGSDRETCKRRSERTHLAHEERQNTRHGLALHTGKHDRLAGISPEQSGGWLCRCNPPGVFMFVLHGLRSRRRSSILLPDDPMQSKPALDFPDQGTLGDLLSAGAMQHLRASRLEIDFRRMHRPR